MGRVASPRLQQILRLLAPYFAVGLFWCGLHSAWLAILAYHAQVLFWSRDAFRGMLRPVNRRRMLLAVPTVLAGPLVYFLLPVMVRADLSEWLRFHHVSGLSLALMIPYFGLVHPFLEQIHWAGLRESTPAAHFLFAGYHMLVLYSLLTVPWLIVCFAVLTAGSFVWQWMTRRTDCITVAVASHVLADLGIVIAAWLRT